MEAYHLNGPVHIGLVAHKHLAEVILLTGLLEYLALEVGESGVVPARAAAALVLDARDLVFQYCCEHRFVLVDSFLLLGCHCSAADENGKRENH